MNCGGLTQQVHASGQPDGLKLGSRPTNDSVLKMDIRGYYLAAAGFKNLYAQLSDLTKPSQKI